MMHDLQKFSLHVLGLLAVSLAISVAQAEEADEPAPAPQPEAPPPQVPPPPVPQEPQEMTPEEMVPEETETPETKWGGTVYGGGDIDSLGNAQVGLRVSYRVFQIPRLVRLSPEAGIEFRKNYVLLKIGGRVDSREYFRLSAFAGAGFLRIQDFTNDAVSALATSDEAFFGYFGGKLRLPSLAGIPVLGSVLGGIPIEGVSLFVAEEVSGLENPLIQVGEFESRVNEWYGYSIQIGVMIGSAGGWYQ